MDERLYFRQLLSGRDFAKDDQFAHQMVNFVYLIGDRARPARQWSSTPAYSIGELIDTAAGDGMRLVGAMATHYHQDHVGGAIFGQRIEGIQELLERVDVPIHVQADEAEWVTKATGVRAELVGHGGGDTVQVGQVEIQMMHTPGHTPGSQCFLVGGRLVAGDTLFLDGCGRTDLPGSDVEQMYDSLQRLAALPDDTVLYPGHRYSLASSASIGAVKDGNYVFRPRTKEQWLTMFGGT